MASKVASHSSSTRHRASTAGKAASSHNRLGQDSTAKTTFLERNRKDLTDLSMAALERSVDNLLDTLAQGGPSARQQALGKRGRAEEHDTDEDVTKSKTKRTVKKPRTKPTTTSKVKPEPSMDHNDGPKLACPYCVRFPARYSTIKTCMGPGWSKAHRVKEHLYRSHALPANMCARCFVPHDSEADLRRHMRAKPACEVTEADREPDGFSPEQERLLRARTSGRTEAEKWREMWRILFPGVDVPRSPYYNTISDSASSLSATRRAAVPPPAAFADADECKAYVRGEILRLAAPLVRKRIDELFALMRQDMTLRVREIMRDLHTQLWRTWSFVQESDDQAASSVSNANNSWVHKSMTGVSSAPPPPSTSGLVTMEQQNVQVSGAGGQFDFGEVGELFQHESIAKYFPLVDDGEGPLFDINAFMQNSLKDDLDFSGMMMEDSAYGTWASTQSDGVGAGGMR